MTTSSVSHSALLYALAALANGGEGGGGGGEGSTVKVRVVATITGAPGTQAKVENLGTDTDVLLQFTIPQGLPGEKGDTGEKGEKGDTGEQGEQGEQGKEALVINATFEDTPVTDVEYTVLGTWFNRDFDNDETVSGVITVEDKAYYVTGKVTARFVGENMPPDWVVTFSKVVLLNGIDGKDGKPGSQWFTSDAEPGTAIEGTEDGDMILYKNGEVFKVADSVPVDTGVDLIPSDTTSMNPYEYALSIGFVGTKNEFDMRFLAALKDVGTATVVTGGLVDSQISENDVTIDGGVAGQKKWDLIMSGNNAYEE